MNNDIFPQEEELEGEQERSSIEELEEYFELSARTRFMVFPRWME
jgi:hypothetical protein